jgi:AcrR family transcriptional regulator
MTQATPVTGQDAPRRPGRPRSEQAETAIIKAALDLFAEDGVDGVCVEAVAARAGVGKATIYRRWANKEDLLVSALASLKAPLPEPEGASVRADLIAIVSALAADAADARIMRQYVTMMTEGDKYPKLLARYRETVVEPRREVLRAVLRRGIGTGELRRDLDVEIATLTITGTLMARSKHDQTAAAPGFAERVVDELLLGLAPRTI